MIPLTAAHYAAIHYPSQRKFGLSCSQQTYHHHNQPHYYHYYTMRHSVYVGLCIRNGNCSPPIRRPIWDVDGKRRHIAARLICMLVQPTVVVVNWRRAGGVGGGLLASVAPLRTPSRGVSAAATGAQPTGEVRRRTDADSPPEMRASMLKSDGTALPLERSGRGRSTSPLLATVSTLITHPRNAGAFCSRLPWHQRDSGPIRSDHS